MNSNERQKKFNIKELTIEQQEEAHLSALAFNGRLLLKGFYMRYQLLRENEEEQGIEMPDYTFLQVLPALHTEGLSAAHSSLIFSADGIAIANCEGGYAHHSREKLALLYLIMQFEIGKRFTLNAVIKDELIQIKRLSDLVFWIEFYKNDKDIRKHLEKEIVIKTKQEPRREAVKKEKANLLTPTELADFLGCSKRTLQRNQKQYVSVMVNKRKMYKKPDHL